MTTHPDPQPDDHLSAARCRERELQAKLDRVTAERNNLQRRLDVALNMLAKALGLRPVEQTAEQARCAAVGGGE